MDNIIIVLQFFFLKYHLVYNLDKKNNQYGMRKLYKKKKNSFDSSLFNRFHLVYR